MRHRIRKRALKELLICYSRSQRRIRKIVEEEAQRRMKALDFGFECLKAGRRKLSAAQHGARVTD
jgi:hypothetical protein